MGGVKHEPISDVERRIVEGLAVSDNYVKKIRPLWRNDLLASPELRRVARWCLDHHEKYGRVADTDLAGIFFERVRAEQIPKAEAEQIEQVLGNISNEYGRGDQFNVQYLFDRTVAHLRRRKLDRHVENMRDLLDRDQIDEADVAAKGFRPEIQGESTWRRASTIEPKSVSWVWKGVIVRGDITLVGGRPKTGKSQLTMSIAAMASSGSAWPTSDNEGRSRDVVLMSAEDAPDYVMVPRLIANGADLSRVHILDPAADTQKARERIEACLDELPHGGIGALVVIDPISAFMPGHKADQITDVRTALRPLGDMARERKVSVVVVHHLRKSSDGDALDAINGSVAFAAVARVIHLLLPDPDRDGRRLFVSAGGNLGADHPGFAFQVVPETINGGIETSRVAWDSAPVNASANEIFTAIRKTRSKPKQERAREWLEEQLRGGPKSQTALEASAIEAGINWATIRIVKAEMGINVTREGGRNGRWMWSLGGDPT